MKRSWDSGTICERAAMSWRHGRDAEKEQVDVFQCLAEARRILVAPNDRVGGLLLGAPVYKQLRQRYAQAQLQLLVDARRESLARQIPFADAVIVADLDRPLWHQSFRDTLASLRETNYDLVFCLGADCSFRLAQLCALSGARMRIGFQHRGLPAYTVQISLSDSSRHESEQYGRMLHMLGIQGDGSVRWELDAAKVTQMRTRYLSDDASSRFVALDLDPGEGKGLTSRQVDDIVGRIVERGARALVLFRAAARKQLGALMSSYGGRVVAFEQNNLASVALLLPSCRTLIACHTDLLHMGMALGIPVVGLFDEDPRRWIPYGNESVKVVHGDDVRSIGIGDIGRALDAALSAWSARQERQGRR